MKFYQAIQSIAPIWCKGALAEQKAGIMNPLRKIDDANQHESRFYADLLGELSPMPLLDCAWIIPAADLL
jgi:hypothetical protein